MHTNTFCKYRKNYSHRLACILLGKELLTRTTHCQLLYFYHCIIRDLESIIKHYINKTVLSYTGQSVTNGTLINHGHVLEFVMGGGGAKFESLFFCFSIFQRGGGQLRK